MLAAQWPNWNPEEMLAARSLLHDGDAKSHGQQQQQTMVTVCAKNTHEAACPPVPDFLNSVDYPSRSIDAVDIVHVRYPTCNTDNVMTKYRQMMHGQIKDAFCRAASGQLYSADDPSYIKLPLLEKELKKAMLMSGHVKQSLLDRWTVCSSNVFGEQQANAVKESSPVMITLNCSPVDDGSKCCHDAGIPLWTPDYLQAIMEVLSEEHAWPPQVTPLVVEYRVCCPLLVALSLEDAPASLDVVNEGGLGPSVSSTFC